MATEIELTQIHIRMMEGEKDMLKDKAHKMNMTLQDFCYLKLIKEPLTFIELEKLMTKIVIKEETTKK